MAHIAASVLRRSADLGQRADEAYGGDDRRTTINAVNWALVAISSVVIVFRLIARALTKQFGVDDALIIPALLVQIIYATLLSAAVASGFGLHYDQLHGDGAVDALHYMTVAQCISFLLSAMPKPAILALLHRLLGINAGVKILFWTLTSSFVMFGVSLAIAWWAQCTPFYRRWDTLGTPGTCWDVSVMLNCAYVFGAYSALLDFMFALYPPLVIGRLAMPLYRKVVISLALGGGVVAAGVTIYRVTLVPDLGKRGLTDPTWADVPPAIWGSIEATILIVAACLPTIGPVVRLVCDKALSTIHLVTGRTILETPRRLSDKKAQVVRAYWYKPLEGFVSMDRKPTLTSGVVDRDALPSGHQAVHEELPATQVEHDATQTESEDEDLHDVREPREPRSSWVPPTQLFRSTARSDDFASIFERINGRLYAREPQLQQRESVIRSGIWLGNLEYEPHRINWEIVSV